MSEWHPWDEAQGGEFMGHEPLGTVAGLGEGVRGFALGDRVTGLCCTPSYAEYCLCKQECLVKIPDNLADEDAVAEPLSCLVSVASKLRLEKAGDTVAVVGTGYMGLGLMTLLRLQGAGRIIAVDPRPEARENAERFGADELYTPEQLPSRYLVTEWNDEMYRKGLPLVAEFAGTQSALTLAGEMTAIHGTLGIGRLAPGRPPARWICGCGAGRASPPSTPTSGARPSRRPAAATPWPCSPAASGSTRRMPQHLRSGRVRPRQRGHGQQAQGLHQGPWCAARTSSLRAARFRRSPANAGGAGGFFRLAPPRASLRRRKAPHKKGAAPRLGLLRRQPAPPEGPAAPGSAARK